MSASTLEFDFPDFTIGTAENPAGPTGCTVFHFPKGATAAVDVRGGAAALSVAELLQAESETSWIDALVFAGGSTYGLEAASGVARKILELRGGSTRFQDIPVVPAAVVYDFAGRNTSVYPDRELGAQAWEAARSGKVALGRVGAGRHVTVGKYFGRAYGEPGGQGAAFIQVGDIKLLAVTVVNALGNILDRQGRILAGSKDPETGERLAIGETIASRADEAEASVTEGNTTLTAVITNAQLDRLQLRRLAVMAHTAMGRVIEPFHTPSDGDSLFMISTGTAKLPHSLSASDLGVLAGSVCQEAVVSSVSV